VWVAGGSLSAALSGPEAGAPAGSGWLALRAIGKNIQQPTSNANIQLETGGKKFDAGRGELHARARALPEPHGSHLLGFLFCISVCESPTETGGSPVPPTERIMEFGGRSYGGWT